MTRLAAFALLFVVSPAWAIDPNPAKLKPTPEQLAKAEELSKQLGSTLFRERDAASRELAAMGRLALSVVEKTLAETSSAEVRSRCEALRPQMEQEDLAARLDAFAADVEGKYEHNLPGWKAFVKQLGDTADSRKLFCEMNGHAATARMLHASMGPKDEFTKMVGDRRMEMYNRMYGRNRIIAANGVMINERKPPEMVEVAGLLFCEGLLGSTTDRRYSYAINSMLMQAPTRDTINDAEKGAALRKLILFWCDSRTEAAEIYQAMNTATNLNLKELPAAKYALKLLEAKAATPFYRAYAVCALAKSGGKEQLPNIKKLFDDKTVISTAFVVGGQVERAEMQLRDIALAMAILAIDGKPEDFGFVARANLNESMKYTYTAWRLPSDEKRLEAFKKWNESQAEPKK